MNQSAACFMALGALAIAALFSASRVESVGTEAKTAQQLPRGKLLSFTDDERRAVLAHGPWPPPLEPDPSNRVSGNREAAALGQRLFFDARLSANGRGACVSCHAPPTLFADGRKTSVGLAAVDRNAPALGSAMRSSGATLMPLRVIRKPPNAA